MIKKLTIGFLLSLALLVVSEYIFLQEIFSQKRTVVLALTLCGVALASYFFFIFFLRYRKALKDS